MNSNTSRPFATRAPGFQGQEIAMSVPRILSRRLVGPFSRFKLEEFQTRFGAIVWMLSDAHQMDPGTGLPAIVAQEESEEAALLRMRAILMDEGNEEEAA